ncbi:MAG: TraB/VirB10 family protein [Candidatus Omnitrophica bacterium]|nr:TraB/VirB10 family protein [Candidatus Omnitrophota bacterium]
MGTAKMKEFIKKNSLVMTLTLCLVVMGMVVGMMSSRRPQKPGIGQGPNIKGSKDIGISVGGADQLAYIKHLEKNYYDFEDRVKDVERRMEGMQSTAVDIRNSQKEIVSKLDASLNVKMEQKLKDFKNTMDMESEAPSEPALLSEVGLTVADIHPSSDQEWVYLPIGSFCQGTLLTGVYAAADANNPLPVLISLDEAFYGPNKTRIPLKGAFVLGKAYGDMVSERALIQIVAISSILPSGHAFENEQDLGYVTDDYGELGIKGQVVYNTGKQLALSFMGGFVAGGAQSIADSQVTTHQTLQGDTAKTVTGSTSKNALFSGVAQSAGRLAQYYEKQAQDMVPAVHIRNGVKVYFIIQKGVPITGLPVNEFNHRRFVD